MTGVQTCALPICHEVGSSIESTIGALQHTLTFVRDQEQKERDEKILLHRPRQTEAMATRGQEERVSLERRTGS